MMTKILHLVVLCLFTITCFGQINKLEELVGLTTIPTDYLTDSLTRNGWFKVAADHSGVLIFSPCEKKDLNSCRQLLKKDIKNYCIELILRDPEIFHDLHKQAKKLYLFAEKDKRKGRSEKFYSIDHLVEFTQKCIGKQPAFFIIVRPFPVR
jgi:hypothetical protein